MSNWKSAKAKRVLAALENIGWRIKRQKARTTCLSEQVIRIMFFSFHDGDEIGPKMMTRIAKKTGLRPEDL